MNGWLMALAGGVLIGLAATLLLWLNGRLAGISGIVGGVVMPRRGDTAWRVAFLLGLIGAGLFGIGWGLAGYCPGPALVGLGVLSPEALWFVPAMLAGMYLHRLLRGS